MVTVIPIVISALGTIPKGLVRELEELEIGGRAETIQTTAFFLLGPNIEKRPGDFLRSARIPRRILNTQGDNKLTLVCKTWL